MLSRTLETLVQICNFTMAISKLVLLTWKFIHHIGRNMNLIYHEFYVSKKNKDLNLGHINLFVMDIYRKFAV